MNRSELKVASNLMLDTEKNHPHYRYMPGDLLGHIYKEFVNPESIHHWLTPQQQREYRQYLPCLLCHKPCAGTCSRSGIGCRVTHL